jgi:hypothetical protein
VGYHPGWEQRGGQLVSWPASGELEIAIDVKTLLRDPKVDPELSSKIIEYCKELAPDLLNTNGDFDVVSEQVGLRPSRSGGARIGLEKVPSAGREKPFTVIHCYGHSGAGYVMTITVFESKEMWLILHDPLVTKTLSEAQGKSSPS